MKIKKNKIIILSIIAASVIFGYTIEYLDGATFVKIECPHTVILPSLPPLSVPISNSGKININTADKEELCKLYGIGNAKAELIIKYRNEHGIFTSAEDIMNVPSIGEKMFEKFKEQIYAD